jgi:prolyl oligopeptidase
VFKVDPARPERGSWREIVAQSEATLEGVQVVGDRLVLSYLRDAHNELAIHDLDGAPTGRIALPGLGSTSGLVGEPDDPLAYFHYTSFTQPDQIFETDVRSGAATLWRAIDVPVDTSRFAVEQVRYPSKDGTEISMFIVRRKDLAQDGKRPTLLYGYGGFSVSLTPPSPPAPSPGSSRAASMPSPTCAAAANTARTGTAPACASTSKTSSTTSPPPPST